MSQRTYYFRSDGSVSPNKPWSDDHIMTTRAESVMKAETQLPYLGPDDVYAEITVPRRGARIMLCASASLQGMGFYPRLFVGENRKGGRGVELLEVPLFMLAPEIVRITEALIRKWGLSVRVEIFDGTTSHLEVMDGSRSEGMEDHLAGHSTVNEVSNSEPPALHLQLMRAVHADLSDGLLSPMVYLVGPKPRCMG